MEAGAIDLVALGGVALASCLLCVALLAALERFTSNTFLAVKRNARSNHQVDARQLGGLALVPAVLLIAIVVPQIFSVPVNPVLVTAGTVMFATGFLDDRFHLPVALRFLVQLFCATICVDEFVNPDYREAVGAMLAIGVILSAVYWTNAVNFMDGLDLMVVLGLGIPLATTGAMLFAYGDTYPALFAFASIGALAGFSFWNRPPARIFLGDSGSLFLGVVSGALILALSRHVSVWVALLPYLYFIADTLTTLAVRIWNRENISQAHSKHAYQIAYRAGWSVWRVVRSVALVNLLLLVFALLAVQSGSSHGQAGMFAGGILVTGLHLLRLRGFRT